MSKPWQVRRDDDNLAELVDSQEERNMEKRAILPLKWAIFISAVAFWILSHNRSSAPPVDVFALFTIYFMFNLGETYLLLLNRVMLTQIRVVSVVSYIVDVLFVTVLIYMDSRYPVPDATATDFYIYFFLLVLRGFALFRTARSHLIANILLVVVFALSLFWQDTDLLSYSYRNNLIRLVFIWLVILMSWFIVQVINRQKTELVRTREKLVQSENLALVGELAAGVAHEINNPISIISAYSEYLVKNSDDTDPRRADFIAINNEASRCEEIVKELLNYARPSSRDITAIDAPALNDEVLEFVKKRRGADRMPRLTRSYENHLPAVRVDSMHLKQALLNIYLNAYQALESTPDPAIDVTIRHQPDQARLVIAIKDNGPGIPKDELRRIFDPFYTTRARGTGLGLSITRRIIEAGGGEIIIQSKVGKGTQVEIILPCEDTAR